MACRQKGWPEQALKIYDKFISGYRMALNYPDSAATEPGLVQRIKQKFKFNREAYFKWVDSVIQPMPEEGKTQLINAMQPYIATMLVVKKDLDTSFFKIKDVGFLKLGIGSAQDIKYLVRVEGLTDETLDDVVLEVKQVRDLSGIDCITIAQKDDPFRVLVGQARIAYEPYKLLGHIRMKGISFWVHSWVDNYKEIEIAESFQSPEDMAEIAYDVGVQLGKGHVNQIAAPLDIQLRREQISLLNQYEPEIKEACIDLGLLTTKAWETFCLKVKRNNTRL